MRRPTVVVGYGVTGRAAAAALAAAGPVVVIDDDPGAGRGAPPGITVLAGADAAEVDAAVAAAAAVVTSPGVPVGHRALRAAQAAGIPVRSEIELAWQILARRDPPRPELVAVTGTNGKTTVVTAVTDILGASGLRAVAGGNIGLPLVEAVTTDVDVVVAEVSSFQLQHTEGWHPAVACWLNLSADHLDWHPDLGHYTAAKGRIWANQSAGDVVVACADDPAVMGAAAGRPDGVRLVTFGATPGADYLDASPTVASANPARAVLVGPGGVDLLAGRHLARALPHDRTNALAAAAVATCAGADAEGVAEGLARWRPLAHRVALVAEAGGVRWYDDSKATTPASVLAATAGMVSVVLIAGGRNKGLDLSTLAATAPPVHHVVALGEAAGEVAAAFAGVVPVTAAADMEAAVAVAHRAARPGDAVVLSPGCASFDQYRSYAERGDDFAARVRRLLTTSTTRRAPQEEHR